MRRWLSSPVPNWTWLVTCLVIGLCFMGGVWMYSRLQVARVDAIERLCLRDNQDSRKNLAFIAKVAPDSVVVARGFFKTEPDCHAYARRTASQPPPQPIPAK